MNGIGLYANISISLPNNERELVPWTLYINPMVPRFAQDILEWVGNLEITGQKDLALEAVRMIAPDTDNIFSASQNGQTQLYIKNVNGVFPHDFKAKLHGFFSLTDKFIGMKLGEAASANVFDWGSPELNELNQLLKEGFHSNLRSEKQE